jgi:hypothetical protein
MVNSPAYPNVDINQLKTSRNVWYHLYDENGDPNNGIFAHANQPDQGFILDQNAPADRMVTSRLEDGQMNQVPEAQLAQYVESHNLGDFQAHSEYGQQDKFNVNVSVGYFDENGEFRTLATVKGTNPQDELITYQTTETREVIPPPEPPPLPPEPKPKTPVITTVANKFNPVDLAIVTPFAPRNALGKAVEAPERTGIAPIIPLFTVDPDTRSPLRQPRQPRTTFSPPAEPRSGNGHSTTAPAAPAEQPPLPGTAQYGVPPTEHPDTTVRVPSERDLLKDLIIVDSEEAKSDAKDAMTRYILNMSSRGIPHDEAERRFRAVYNYVKLKNAGIEVKLKPEAQISQSDEDAAVVREDITKILKADTFNYNADEIDEINEISSEFPQYIFGFAPEDIFKKNKNNYEDVVVSFARAYAAVKELLPPTKSPTSSEATSPKSPAPAKSKAETPAGDTLESAQVLDFPGS